MDKPAAAPRLLTIGYQGASLRAFIDCLRAAGVHTLVDVRHTPFSRRPEFRQGALRRALGDAGIAYDHKKPLGNIPEARDAAAAGDRATYRRLFQDHLGTPAARMALQDVLRLAGDGPVCLMCLERLPEDCHRLMVADALLGLANLELANLRPAGEPDPAQPRLF